MAVLLDDRLFDLVYSGIWEVSLAESVELNTQQYPW